MQKKGLIFFLLLIFTSFLLAQGNMKIKGKVTGTNGEPLIGANVQVKSLAVGAATDLDGKYEIDVPKANLNRQEVELTASFIGYKPKSVKVVLGGGILEQNFILMEDIFQSEEVVVTGIASKTSKSVAEVSVARISATDLQTLNAFNGISQLVAGKVAGVQMTNATGNVGGGFRFQVRGGGGLNGTGQPTIYVDGVRVENQEVGLATGGQLNSTLAGLNSNDIDKVEFLKGPAAAAMYGTNGANGVVLITTKNGKAGKAAKKGLNFEYRFNSGYNEKQYDYDRADYLSAGDANKAFRRGFLTEHYFSLAGGNPDLRYFTSIENRNENGILSTNNQKRTTARVNLSALPYNNLSLKLNSYYVNNQVFRPNGDNTIYGIMGNVLLSPTSYGWTSAAMIEKALSVANTNQFIGSVAANYQPIENMEINATVGIDNSDLREERTYPIGFNGLVPKGQKTLWHRNNTNINMDFNASYSYSLYDIQIKSIIGAQAINTRTKTILVTGDEFNSDLISTLAAAGKISGYGEAFLHTREAGIFTEHAFSYQDQYFLTLGLRKDYAAAIGSKAPAITYPKASVAVRLDKYDFLPSFFDLLKVRAAYGEGGILPALTDGIPLLWTTQVGGYGAGAVINNIGNEYIQPERVKELEFGFEAELFKSLSLEFTYYNQTAVNSIIPRPLAYSGGKIGTQPYNIGKVKGSGVEFKLDYNAFRTPEHSLDFTLIWNYQTNKVEDLGGNPPMTADPNAIAVGYARSQFYTFKTADVVYDANGKYLRAVSTTDRVDCGSPFPDHSGSVSVNFRFFNNFQFYALGEFGLNNKMYNMTQVFANRFGNGKVYNDLKAKLGLSGGTAGITALTPGTDEYKAVAREYANLDPFFAGNYVQDAEFFIIREISLSLDLTDFIQEAVNSPIIKSYMLGVSGRNLVTFSKYQGADIGLNYNGAQTQISRGQDFLTMPTPRTINFWLRLGF